MKKIHFIINADSIKEIPIITLITTTFQNSSFNWDLSIVHNHEEAISATQENMLNSDIIGIYGGDGSVMTVARVLHKSQTPLIILPGGTANVMAKELDLPLDVASVLKMLAESDYEILDMDMGLVNGCPFLIRVNLGIFADMVTEASLEMKEHWGKWAYGITAFHLLNHNAEHFNLIIDGQEVELEAVAMTITNAGNIGQKGFKFLPGISISDGYLDVIALNKSDFTTIFQVTGTTLFQTESSILKHWRAKEIIIKMLESNNYVCDDVAEQATQLQIIISPQSLKVIVPKTQIK